MGITVSDETINEVRLVSRENNTGLKPHEAGAELECPCCASKITVAVSADAVKPDDKVDLIPIASFREGISWRRRRI